MEPLAAQYHFRAATLGDLPLLSHWQAQPHVSRWWDDAPAFDTHDLADPRLSHWIVEYRGTPLGFLQDYAVHGWSNHHFAYLPDGARGIDQFIGEAAILAQGHGPAFVAQRVEALFAAGAPVVATDPHPDNARAIRAYEKAGFACTGGAMETEWGRVLPFERWRVSTL